jgi:hypothetical protein
VKKKWVQGGKDKRGKEGRKRKSGEDCKQESLSEVQSQYPYSKYENENLYKNNTMIVTLIAAFTVT